MDRLRLSPIFFFFNDTATTEIYTLSLHDALPIWESAAMPAWPKSLCTFGAGLLTRSEEHTSELQSRLHLVCRLLLEKKKNRNKRGMAIQSLHHHRTDSRVQSSRPALRCR